MCTGSSASRAGPRSSQTEVGGASRGAGAEEQNEAEEEATGERSAEQASESYYSTRQSTKI